MIAPSFKSIRGTCKSIRVTLKSIRVTFKTIRVQRLDLRYWISEDPLNEIAPPSLLHMDNETQHSLATYT